MHLSPLRNSIISIVIDLWRKLHIVTKQNALSKEKLNFLINFRGVAINFYKGVIPFLFILLWVILKPKLHHPIQSYTVLH